MKVLVLGAGGIGGYFGGRLAESGVDVTFLVRERRYKQMQERGLRVQSIHGDLHLEQPQMIQAGEAAGPFDVVLLSNKAYTLTESIDAIAPYVSEHTVVIPLLNGIAHMELLWDRFGRERVLGGLCFIETTLNAEGDVVQTSPIHDAVFGEWEGGKSERVEKIEQAFANINGTMRASNNIQREAWHKYLFIATFSGITTLMNSAVGPIREAAYGVELTRQLAEEIVSVMQALEAPIKPDIVEKQMETFQNQRPQTKSSMLRDMEKGLPVEADHLQGYLLERAEQRGLSTPLLKVVYNNLKVYELKREEGK
ncbi:MULTISPECIES: 2-dehydropantoate 2-reductase [Brevibacillus]|jgi:2-dehydropantoate 2-reductase|uniref:2-dehydropantoate 2-reductase n=1 Tax=Brevibacillus TaxID=55080 RepID=UPI001C24A3C6|nr:2-dehydropantoate 2-reductase [Brevibacillus parabrevis]MBU8713912.1 2-dehydropantoate 2-reductase [Brevibacillus parabrevis]MDR4998322.1 2-dehydropantoate 2-reductase [Brevibacillus parabrevis]MED1723072.1 2-dehydropantoate 2-reductase [Brevibacillus parabrevis]WDV94568.1 2-dehydropantoate 2-reductase [Brevibacillus parabrevis]